MRDLGKLIYAKGFKSCPKFNKSPNLVTLSATNLTLQAKQVNKRYSGCHDFIRVH